MKFIKIVVISFFILFGIVAITMGITREADYLFYLGLLGILLGGGAWIWRVLAEEFS